MTRYTLTPEQIADAVVPGAVTVDLYDTDGEEFLGLYGPPARIVIDIGRLRIDLPLDPQTPQEMARAGELLKRVHVAAAYAYQRQHWRSDAVVPRDAARVMSGRRLPADTPPRGALPTLAGGP